MKKNGRAYIRAGNFLKAEEWFLQLLNPHLSPELGNIAPDSSTFNYMIRLCAQAGELVFAEAHIEDMKRFGLKPTLQQRELVALHEALSLAKATNHVAQACVKFS